MSADQAVDVLLVELADLMVLDDDIEDEPVVQQVQDDSKDGNLLEDVVSCAAVVQEHHPGTAVLRTSSAPGTGALGTAAPGTAAPGTTAAVVALVTLYHHSLV